jgi:hypothetical protein
MSQLKLFHWRRLIAGAIERATFHRVRFLWNSYDEGPRFSPIWTPWTYGLKTGGWVHLNWRWILETVRDERARKQRCAGRVA